MSDPLKSVYPVNGDNPQDAFLDDLEAVMGTEPGRRIIWRQIQQSNLTTNAMTGNSWTYFDLGKQQAGNEMMQIMFTERFLLLFRKMQDEALLAEKAKSLEEKEKKYE